MCPHIADSCCGRNGGLKEGSGEMNVYPIFFNQVQLMEMREINGWLYDKM